MDFELHLRMHSYSDPAAVDRNEAREEIYLFVMNLNYKQIKLTEVNSHDLQVPAFCYLLSN